MTDQQLAQSLEDGLIAHYLFDSNAQDTSGHNLHGTVYGATLTTDRFGNAESTYQFDGVDDYIEVPHNDLLNTTDNLTISLWLKQEEGKTSGYRLVDKTTAGVNDGYNFDTYDGSTGRKLRLCAGRKNASANTVYSLNEWHHVAVVVSKGVSTFYLDGMSDGSATHGTLQTNSLSLLIGSAHGSKAQFFKGALDDIRIYNRALSEQEIKEINQLPSSKKPEEKQPETTGTPQVEITHICYKGEVKKTQSDEYVEIVNKGTTTADVAGWKISSGLSKRQAFIFPAGTKLEAGKSFRVYTNEVHPETGGFTFGSSTGIWNDKGDEAKLFDAQGNQVATLAYGSSGIPGIKTELGVPQLTVKVSPSAINKQMAMGSKVTFVGALKLAINSFLEDDSQTESPLGQILNDPGAYGLAKGADKAAAIKVLRSYLNQPTSTVTLQTAKSQYPPENGEKVDANWIFLLQLKEMSGLYWVIVDRSGALSAYNYGVS